MGDATNVRGEGLCRPRAEFCLLLFLVIFLIKPLKKHRGEGDLSLSSWHAESGLCRPKGDESRGKYCMGYACEGLDFSW